MKFTFVILHYLTDVDTDECIQSILSNIEYDDFNIVVVDNGSPNNSVEILNKKYRTNDKVTIIKTNKNLGFAKGNNYGFMYAKKELHTDFVVMINNDTIINQRNFLLKVLEEYEKSHFHILGPDIVTRDGFHQNPLRMNILSEEEVKKVISKSNSYIFFNRIKCEKKIVQAKALMRKLLNKPLPVKNTSEQWKVRHEHIQLHGSCLIFSPEYVSKFNGLYDKTFLYMEEDILFYIAQQENLKVIYSPEIEIYHKEDASTNALIKSDDQKRLFKYRNVRASAKEFLKMMQDHQLYKKNIMEDDHLNWNHVDIL